MRSSRALAARFSVAALLGRAVFGAALLGRAVQALAAPVPDAVRLNEEGNALASEGRWSDALVRYEAALALAPAEAVIRRNVAEACASLGSEAHAASQWDDAERRFARAAAFVPDEPRYALWLGVVREAAGRGDAAGEAYRSAARLAPQDARPLARLGRLLVGQGKVAEGAAALEKALALAPDDPALAELLAQARRDAAFEGKLSETGVSLFDVSYDGQTNAEAAQRVLSMLLAAQTEVANDLGLAQRARVRVVLYGEREYADVTSAPEWAAAHFDGRIRLPIKDLDRREREIRASVYHEYTHALLTEALPKCPSWIHEGLAQAEEYGRVLGADAEGSRTRGLSAIPDDRWLALETLERPFAGLGSAVPQAYAQSLGFVRYLDGRFGRSAMQVLLSNWRERPGTAWRDAFREAYGVPVEDLYADWRASLK